MGGAGLRIGRKDQGVSPAVALGGARQGETDGQQQHNECGPPQGKTDGLRFHTMDCSRERAGGSSELMLEK